MSDRYSGKIKCPYCKELTDFCFCTGNENYSDYCRECGKEFRLDVYIKARKK